MNILGISVYYHDSATCLVRDGKIIDAAQSAFIVKRRLIQPLLLLTYQPAFRMEQKNDYPCHAGTGM